MADYLGGLFSVEGLSNLFHFGSGGRGRGNIPPGTYPITPEAVGRWGARHGAIGINNNAIYDPKIGKTREGIEIHAGNFNHHTNKLITAGCFGIDRKEFPQVKAQIMKLIKEKGAAYINIGKDGRASIASSKTDLPATTQATQNQPHGSAFAAANPKGMTGGEATKALGMQSSAYLAKPSLGVGGPFDNIAPGMGMKEAAAPVKQANKGTVVFAHGMQSRYGKTSPAQVEASVKKYADARGMDFKAIPISGDKRQAQLKALQSYPFKKGDVAVGFSAGGYNVAKAKLPAGVERVVTGAPRAKGDQEFPGRHMQQLEGLAKSATKQPGGGGASPASPQPIAQKTPTLQQVIDKNRNDPRFSQFQQYETMIPDRNMPVDKWAKNHPDILNHPMVPDSARQVIQAAGKPQEAAPTVLKPEKTEIAGRAQKQGAAFEPPLPPPRPSQQPAGTAQQIQPGAVQFNTETGQTDIAGKVQEFLTGKPGAPLAAPTKPDALPHPAQTLPQDVGRQLQQPMGGGPMAGAPLANAQPPGLPQQIRADAMPVQAGGAVPPIQTAPASVLPPGAPLPQTSAAPAMSTMTGGGFPMTLPQPGVPAQPGLSAGSPVPTPPPMPMPSMGMGGGGGPMGGGMGMGAPEMAAGEGMGGAGMGGGGGGGGGLGGIGKGISSAFQAMQQMIPKPNVQINPPIRPDAAGGDIISRVLQFLQPQQQQQQEAA